MATMLASMIQNQRFVLEAGIVKASNGSAFQSNPMLNFIAVDSLTGVLKLGSSSITGANLNGHRLVEGAIRDCDWLDIPNELKEEFKEHARDLQLSQKSST